MLTDMIQIVELRRPSPDYSPELITKASTVV